jgi:hypothetical protein
MTPHKPLQASSAIPLWEALLVAKEHLDRCIAGKIDDKRCHFCDISRDIVREASESFPSKLPGGNGG